MNSSKNNVNHNTTPKPESTGKYRWKVGDKCMAKYWEDNVVSKIFEYFPYFIMVLFISYVLSNKKIQS